MEECEKNKDKRIIFLKPKKYKRYWRIYSKTRLSISKKDWSTKKCTCKCKIKERDYLKKDLKK